MISDISNVGKPQYTLEYIMAQESRLEEKIPGACEVWHDRSMGKWHLTIQLDKERLWFLRVFVRDDGSFERFSLDEEAANDSHYEFAEEEKIRDSMYIPGDEHKYFHEILIRFVNDYSGYTLLELIMPYVTAQVHFT